MTTINLDHLDTKGGDPTFEFRGETFTVLRRSVEESFVDPFLEVKNLDDLKEVIAEFFTGKREFNRFWKVVNNRHGDLPPLALGELMTLARRVMAIANGSTRQDGEPDPKDSDS